MIGHRLGAGLRLGSWLAGLTASVVMLVRLGHGSLAAPSAAGGGPGVAQWLTTRDPSAVLMTAVRLAALGTALYLLAATVFALVARATHSATLISLSNRVSAPLIRRVVGSTVGLAIAVGPLMVADAGWAAPAPAPTWSAVVGDTPGPPVSVEGPTPGSSVSAVEAPAAGVPVDPPTLRRLPDDRPGPAGDPTTLLPATSRPTPTTATPTTSVPPPTTAPTTFAPTPPPTTTAPATSAPTPEARPTITAAPSPGDPGPSTPPPRPLQPAQSPPTAPRAADSAPTWAVRPGDHLWLIAARTLEAARQRPVSDAEVAPYWETVVRENRSRLPDPANADLLYVGMHIVLPPTP